jgi:mRNA interferase MazF
MPEFHWAVVKVDLEPVIGSEEGLQRPALIVSNEEANQALPNVTVLPMTTSPRKLYPAEVILPAGAGGQPKDSIVMAHQIRTISKRRIIRFYGYLTDAQLRKAVEEAIMEHLDLFLEE